MKMIRNEHFLTTRITIFLILLYKLKFCTSLNITDCNNKCENGECVEFTLGEADEFKCVCAEQFMGIFCERPNPCYEPETCQNGGNCTIDSDNDFSVVCVCIPPYSGDNCTIKDPCGDKKICLNDGTCVSNDDIAGLGVNFYCECVTPYEGDHCDVKNRCRIDTGECIDSLGDGINACYPCTADSICELKSNDEYDCICEPPKSPQDDCHLRELPTTILPYDNFTDFDDLNSTIGENTTEQATEENGPYIIPWVVGLSLLLYIILLLICSGHRDHPNLIVVADIFNKFDEETLYLITFELKDEMSRKNVGSVHYRLYGSLGKSKIYTIEDSFLKSSKSVEFDHFLISSKNDLGYIQKIRLWQECPNSKSHYWYLERIVVRNLKTDYIWFFIAHMKRIKISNNQKSYMVFDQRSASHDEIRFYQMNYCINYFNELREHHLWISYATCPPRSLYTPAERLTTTMAVVSIYFAFLLLMYGKPPVDFFYVELGHKFGDFLTLYSFLVGSLCCMLVFPFSLALIWIFSGMKRKKFPTLVVIRRSEPLNMQSTLENVDSNQKIDDKMHVQSSHQIVPIMEPQKINESGDETDEEEESRWDKLDREQPDRIMVVGVENQNKRPGEEPNDPEESSEESEKSVSLFQPRIVLPVPVEPIEVEIIEKIQIPVESFQIPSTDNLEIEDWISKSLDVPGETVYYPESFVQNLNSNPNKVSKGPERLQELGRYAALDQLKKDDQDSLIYPGTRTMSSLERIIDQDIRASYKEPEKEPPRVQTMTTRRTITTNPPIDSLPLQSNMESPKKKKESKPQSLSTIKSEPESIESPSPVEETEPPPRPKMKNKRTQTVPITIDSKSPLSKYIVPELSPVPVPERKDETKETMNKNTNIILVQIYDIPWDYKGTHCRCSEDFLPWAWAIHLTIIIVFCTVTFIIGFYYEYSRGLEWCGSCVWAACCSIFILEMVKIGLVACFTNKEMKNGVRVNVQVQKAIDHLHLTQFNDHQKLPKRYEYNYIIYRPEMDMKDEFKDEIFQQGSGSDQIAMRNS